MLVVERETEKRIRDVVQIKRELEILRQKIAAENNMAVADKISECLHKWEAKQLHIGFCGHFSAGKSSMINRLIGQELLPASPIPTSANVVTIAYGKPQAVIQFTNEDKRTLPLSEVERWKEYCLDGVEVERVHLFLESELLADGIQLLDTPGIDSTDEAHQAATERALHLADVILFVTDYNHVQSETNFHFIKELKEKGKKLFLIVNQIDKHREEELSLATFLERVKEGLAQWGIQLDGLLCTSLRQEDHPYNQFNELVGLFDQLKQVKDELIEEHLVHVLDVLLDEHQAFLSKEQEKERQALKEQIEKLKEKSKFSERPSLLEEYRQSERAFSDFYEQIKTELEPILENAIITPYETTQAAKNLIESYQQDFKVGWLFSKKKTEAERQKRLDILYKDLTVRVEAQMEWHLKELLRKKAEKFGLTDQDYLTRLQDWSLPLPEEWLVEPIKGETVSGEFVYQYTKELKSRISRLYREQVLSLAERAEPLFLQKHEELFAPLADRLADYKQLEALEKQLELMDRQVKQHIEGLKQTLRTCFPLRSLKVEWNLAELTLLAGNRPKEKRKESKQLAPGSRAHEQEIWFNQEHLLATIEKLERAARLLQPIASLKAFTGEIREKAERLRQNKFTICLFGAFSAGKSSFANALLGGPVLPVSPNPTTAAINRVLPATEEHPAGSAMIIMKSREQVEEEISGSLIRLRLRATGDILKDLEQIKKVEPNELPVSLKPYYSFLYACWKGFKEAEAILGTHFKVDEREFQQYVAVEHKACFVESIQLYHDAYLLSQGMEIIDTPGADSIYSRHTNVTFNFIKHADVILYVTYYNHAFSRADRAFLEQLGRVKDQFALDKMFFLVNACDLAQSEEELEGVLEHVELNLLQSGIRFPRIFPISSLRVLQGERDQGWEAFEKAFFQFIQQDISSLVLEAARKDLEKALSLVKEMKEELQLSANRREEKIKELNAQLTGWLTSVDQESYPSFLVELEKEIKEHFYYIKQRLFYNFPTRFQEAFHPSLLTKERGAKEQLSFCLDELIHALLFQLTEEFKATSLRVENFIFALQERIWNQWQRKLAEEGISLKGTSLEKQDLGIPSYGQHLASEQKQKLEDSLVHFKNPKQFFEQGGKEKLAEELEKRLVPAVEQYLQENMAIFLAYYQQSWHKVMESWKERLKEEVLLAVESRLSALRGELTVGELTVIIEQLQALFD